MNTINNPPVRTYFIGHDGTKIICYGYTDPDCRTDSAASNFETFINKALYDARLQDFGIIPEEIIIDSTLGIDAIKLGLKACVDKIRADKLVSPVIYNNNKFDNDAISCANLQGTLTAILAGVPLPEDFTWRSYDNVNIPFIRQNLVELSTVFLQHKYACYQRSWALKSEIDASIDPLSIDIKAGWP